MSECMFEVNPKNILPKELQYKPKQYAGELLIEQYLLEHNIKYLREYTFNGCYDIGMLRFDFVILRGLKIVAAIEYDGVQHTQVIKFSSSVNGDKLYFDNIRHDSIKTKYCKKHKIKLYRISYKDKDNINIALDTIFN